MKKYRLASTFNLHKAAKFLCKNLSFTRIIGVVLVGSIFNLIMNFVFFELASLVVMDALLDV